MAEIEDISIVNRLFSPEENLTDFSEFFDKEVIIEPEEKINKLKADLAQGKTLDKILNEEELLPMVERFPSHFYEDGINSLKFSLRARQHVAMQHWSGNTRYTLRDYISGSVSH
ncbi:hypothetical protein CKO23_15315 [Thiocystis violacea]|nr:hypothetical protein [Thiocystis violacea]